MLKDEIEKKNQSRKWLKTKQITIKRTKIKFDKKKKLYKTKWPGMESKIKSN
jgi:hypothetical protein